jgi:hypothetical protein
MLIDEFLPIYDFDERHETTIHAPAEKVYAALNSFDFNESAIISWLFWLRGLTCKENRKATAKALTLRDMTKFDFVLLGEKRDEEILFGLVGKFWSPKGDLQKVKPEEFSAFAKEGFAKAAWNFSLSEIGEAEIRLKTETRVQCLGKSCHESFRFYWRFVKPFSGWIRRETLRLIKQKAEAEVDVVTTAAR